MNIMGRIALLMILAVFLAAESEPPRSSAQLAPLATTRCDCKPEFNVVAEGRGTCEVVKDDTLWCKLKFNDGTSEPSAKKSYEDSIGKLGIATRDPFSAAKDVNRISPDKWPLAFTKNNFSTLIAHALWDTEGFQILKSVHPVATSRGDIDAVYKALSSPPPNVVISNVEAYQAIASWGCLQLARGSLSIMVKTPHSTAPHGCAWK